jgi:hypothetical protein
MLMGECGLPSPAASHLSTALFGRLPEALFPFIAFYIFYTI